jgi:hypothetical protein
MEDREERVIWRGEGNRRRGEERRGEVRRENEWKREERRGVRDCTFFTVEIHLQPASHFFG